MQNSSVTLQVIDMQEMTAIQLRVLGCLVEKKETTPEQSTSRIKALFLEIKFT